MMASICCCHLEWAQLIMTFCSSVVDQLSEIGIIFELCLTGCSDNATNKAKVEKSAAVQIQKEKHKVLPAEEMEECNMLC